MDEIIPKSLLSLQPLKDLMTCNRFWNHAFFSYQDAGNRQDRVAGWFGGSIKIRVEWESFQGSNQILYNFCGVFNLEHASLLPTEIPTKVCTFRWMFQQSMIIESCFDSLNIQPGANESLCSTGLYLHNWKKLLCKFWWLLLHPAGERLPYFAE